MRKALTGLLMMTCAAPLLAAPTQPELVARAKTTITVNGLRVKDLNASGRLEPCEDWRLPARKRATDLVRRMSLAERAGMMLIAANNPDCGGGISERGRDLIDTQKNDPLHRSAVRPYSASRNTVTRSTRQPGLKRQRRQNFFVWR